MDPYSSPYIIPTIVSIFHSLIEVQADLREAYKGSVLRTRQFWDPQPDRLEPSTVNPIQSKPESWNITILMPLD